MDWSYHDVECAACGQKLKRRLWRPKDGKRIQHFFCDNKCKGTWQREQREALGWTEEWLRQKYLAEGLDCTQIAAIVHRNSKRVWDWLRDYGIPTRPRGSNYKQLPKGREPGFILPESAKAKLRQARIESPNLPHLVGGEHWLHTVPKSEHPNWKGGITPDRQAVYATEEWKEAVKIVWRRANARCERCGKHHNAAKTRGTFHIHHIIGFEDTSLRTDASNLMLVCRKCHLWIHSNRNKDEQFIGEDERCRIRGR